MNDENLSRRQFINQSFRSAGLCVLSGAAAAAPGVALHAAATSATSPFAYDVDRLSRIDPKLLVYEQIRKISGLGAEPRRIAIAPQNRLYVATGAGVDILDGEAGKVAEIPLSAPAQCVAVADDGTIYVGLRTHVEVFDAKGKSIAVWEAPTEKAWLTGLAVGANDLFAADSAGRVIYRYDRSGKMVGRIGEKNPDRNVPGLIVPSPYLDVKLGPDGLLRVNNTGRHCVEVFTANGDLELSWGKPGLAIESFCGCCNPVGLALLGDGRCITCEKGLPRVKVYSADHTLEAVVAGPEQFPDNGRPGQNSNRRDGTLGGLDAAVDSSGRIYILDLVAGDVRVMKRKS
ncbi:MAG TPA: hypothetical protein VFE51_16230 [Verrucomicrobiae bacterium]|nr:hypothetical protein [Verrucomicrobiae bacterium]